MKVIVKQHHMIHAYWAKHTDCILNVCKYFFPITNANNRATVSQAALIQVHVAWLEIMRVEGT